MQYVTTPVVLLLVLVLVIVIVITPPTTTPPHQPITITITNYDHEHFAPRSFATSV